MAGTTHGRLIIAVGTLMWMMWPQLTLSAWCYLPQLAGPSAHPRAKSRILLQSLL